VGLLVVCSTGGAVLVLSFTMTTSRCEEDGGVTGTSGSFGSVSGVGVVAGSWRFPYHNHPIHPCCVFDALVGPRNCSVLSAFMLLASSVGIRGWPSADVM